MPSNPYAPPPAVAAARPAVARPAVLSLVAAHPFGRAALIVALSAVVVTGLGRTIPALVILIAACASAGSNVRRGFRDLSQTPAPAPVADGAPASDSVRRMAATAAVVGSAAAAAVLLAFYVPGMVDGGHDLDDIVVALALPVVAVALPYALLAFIRVRLVLLIASGVLAWTLIASAVDLFTGPPDGRGESLIVFGMIIVINFVTAVTALVVSGSYRLARRT